MTQSHSYRVTLRAPAPPSPGRVELGEGLAAVQARQLFAALDRFERAAEKAPNDPEIQAWLGQTLCNLGRRLEGVDHLRAAAGGFLAPATPNLAKAREIISQLQGWGDMEGSLPFCRKLVQVAPDDPQAHQLLAATCGQLNLLSEAMAAGERALELAPNGAMTQVLQASLEADAGFVDRARQRLEAALASGLDDRAAFRAHKELARVCDTQGDDAAVFPHVEAAAALAPLLPEFRAQDPQLIPRTIAANAEGFDAELLGRWRAEDMAGEARAPVFVMGFYRSGTTLTQRVLSTHPDVFVADEAGLMWALHAELDRIDPGPGAVADKLRRLDPAGARMLRRRYWELARDRYGESAQRPVFVDKFTMNTIDVGFINVIFPDARIVFMTRDPRDVCLSCVLQLMTPTPATVHLLTWRGTAGFYAAVMDFWLDIRERLTLAVLDVRYEEAVADFEATYRRLFAFLDLTWTPAAMEFHSRAAGRFVASPSRNQVSRPLYATAVGRWRRHADKVREVEDLIQPFVEELGYGP